MSGLDGIVFDKDGTLFDFEATWSGWTHGVISDFASGNSALAHRLGDAVGYDVPGRRFQPNSVAIAGTPRQIAEALSAHLPDRSVDEVLAHLDQTAALAQQHPVVPLEPLFDTLRARNLRLGIATNDTEMPARAHLTGAGVIAHFDFIAGSDSGFGGKPAPGQLLAFAEALDLDPARCAMVGDSPHDLDAGRAAGMACVAVLTGPGTADDLRPLADVVLRDIGHLPAWLDAR